ncbi:MAG: UDP-N-acetylmuramoylalanyl-D-glutamyl-2,6-diaminopimelate--D-alanyl-D-alanine ligase [Alphaproteobacteria bacterium]|nr:MAG: UDP-N-acetylmuramoylalanyl-D-glutamyl-2,6-diaminopimelate--D-alanyl-D-alanine ligase [Alphaproteobacteria bacterium]
MTAASLWTAEEVARATGGMLEGDKNWTAAGVSIDSRTLIAGDLFVALEGPHNDGHDYVIQAFDQGAAAALTLRSIPGISAALPRVEVRDTLAALTALGVEARDRSSAWRIAVTGSVGKTGTKEMLKSALGDQAPTHASAASHNNLWGVPLTLSRMPQDTAFGIFEIGMNHAGEIIPLTRSVAPHIAIITTVQPVHLEFFDSVDAIADAKAEIFDGLVPPAIAVINGDIVQSDRLKSAARNAGAQDVILFGEGRGLEARLDRIDIEQDGSRVTADICGTALVYRINWAGRHWAINSLAVLAAVHAVGADLERAADNLGHLSAMRGRGAVQSVTLPKGSITVIDESYNANPASMAAAIRTLGTCRVPAGGRRIAVLGDMLELGEDAPGLHSALLDDLDAAAIDLVFLSGPQMKNLWHRLDVSRRGRYAEESSGLQSALLDEVCPGDTVMIKGSLGSRMAPLVQSLLDLAGIDGENTKHAGGGD